MVGIAGAIQNDRARNGGDGGLERGHACQVAAFGEIGYAFYQRRTQTALAFGRFRLRTKFPSRMASATWLIPKRRGISRYSARLSTSRSARLPTSRLPI